MNSPYWVFRAQWTQIARRYDDGKPYWIYELQFIPDRRLAATRPKDAIAEARRLGFKAPVVGPA